MPLSLRHLPADAHHLRLLVVFEPDRRAGARRHPPHGRRAENDDPVSRALGEAARGSRDSRSCIACSAKTWPTSKYTLEIYSADSQGRRPTARRFRRGHAEKLASCAEADQVPPEQPAWHGSYRYFQADLVPRNRAFVAIEACRIRPTSKRGDLIAVMEITMPDDRNPASPNLQPRHT